MNAKEQWKNFWRVRGEKINLTSFKNNFRVMLDIINAHYFFPLDNYDLNGMKSLEVGCGRGTMSVFLEACSVEAHKIDKYFVPYNNINYRHGDAFAIPYREQTFDLVFTYGLLEHYPDDAQLRILKQCWNVCRIGGIQIHYIVPSKLTNFFEDTSVYRDDCIKLRKMFPGQWVFPIFGDKIFKWRTNKFLGKGYFFYITRGGKYGINNSRCDFV